MMLPLAGTAVFSVMPFLRALKKGVMFQKAPLNSDFQAISEKETGNWKLEKQPASCVR
jgi:hypothetical protein